MAAMVAAHLVAAALAPLLVRLLDRNAYWVLALVPAGSLAWVLSRTPIVAGAGETVTESHSWVDALSLQVAFRLSTLSWAMALVVTGVGALVLAYCRFYFRAQDEGSRRFAAVLTAFAGAMLGLVLADDLVLMYVFWELTTILSYLLIGHNPERRANRRAALMALLVTTAGGLAMLVGVLILGQAADTYLISEILQDPPGGTAVAVAVVLLLIGAVSKSALIPFHFWLPGAMAAPTPVSAYLHAAAMVKAGVYLIALLAPAFVDVGAWRPTVFVLGTATMLLGGLRALRQDDLKLLLAYGTVAQLGLLVVLVGGGTEAAALAGLAMLGAHALFKAALFLCVGIIDRCAGTRDIGRLSGLWRSMPAVFVAAALATASMAGLPPFTAFVAKETAYAAFLSGAPEASPAVSGLLLAGLVIGSALTVAYSARFLWGGFAGKAGSTTAQRRPPGIGFVLPPLLLALGGLAAGFAGPFETRLLHGYTDLFPEAGEPATLKLWHGPQIALLASLSSLVLGVALFARRRRVETWQRRLALRRLDAERAYRWVMRGVDRLAVEVTGATQRGSLPVYLAVILVIVVAVPGTALIVALLGSRHGPQDWHWWDTPAQALVAVVMVVAAIETARSRRRLKAVILTGAVGYGVALLFVLHGAPDLGLTQVLVETITLVICILVLRRLPTYFSDRPLTGSRWLRLAVGLAVGFVMAALAFVSATARTARPISEGYPGPTESYGGGENIVNVILVDIRAWDTMGEISVLVVAATGVASLIFLITGRSGRWSGGLDESRAPRRSGEVPRPGWLVTTPMLAPERRSIVLEVVTRLLFHAVLVYSVYLLFAGHNSPGGGFAGGLTAGLALTVRYLAGGRRELNVAARVDAGLVLGIGLFVATGSGLVPMLFGEEVLRSALIDITVPLLGHVHFSTALFFDVGVYLVVVGLVLDMLRSLGGGIDSDTAATGNQPAQPAAPAEPAVPAVSEQPGSAGMPGEGGR